MGHNILTGDVSLSEEVTEIIRDRIIKGEYAMGEKLIENKIATELKVSRTPVRDAFKQLSKEQIVEYIPNKGCFARGFSMKDMSDIYAVRKAVEQLAITWVVEKADEKGLSDLRRQLELMYQYTVNNTYDKLLDANEEYHNMIYRMAESRFIVQVLRAYQDYVHTARKLTLRREEDLPQIYEEHAAIYTALENHDTAAAVSAVGIHLENSCRRAEERWMEQRSDKTATSDDVK